MTRPFLPRPGLPGKARGVALSAALSALAALTACVEVPVPTAPVPGTAAPSAAPAAAPVAETSKSAAARAYFAEVQRALLAEGLMRTETNPGDAPFTDRMLAENFLRIALFDEYARQDGSFVRAETASVLRRWEGPVRVSLRFGASVPADRRATDRARVASYLARLSQVTGHPISLVETGGNFIVHVVSEDEREALGPQISAQLPGLSASDIADITGMARTTYCLVYAQSAGNSGTYVRAAAVIRSEHPDLMRLSCFHEEIAQGLGLANDSPRARPSIFNDDEEFALLTRMDELMLQMLYDPSLRPGMRAEEARAIVFDLARRLTGGAS